ncbi:hypothetical protein D3C87_2153620 [compost metagenome]
MREVFAHQRVQFKLKGAEFRRCSGRLLVWLAHHTRTNGDVGQTVDEDQPTRYRILLIFVEH